jgi:hypothetical protein
VSNWKNLLANPFVAAVLALLPFLLGVGPQPFTDLESFTQWAQTHLPQIAGSGTLAFIVFHAVKLARQYISSRTISTALQSQRLHVADLVTAVEDGGGGSEAAVRFKSVLVDGAFVSLYHAFEHDPELTDALNAAHTKYRQKRVPAPTNKSA